MVARLRAQRHAKEILEQVIDAFGGNPGFFDELVDTIEATRTATVTERTGAIQVLCQKWRYPEEEVFRALVPASWVAQQQDLKQRKKVLEV